MAKVLISSASPRASPASTAGQHAVSPDRAGPSVREEDEEVAFSGNQVAVLGALHAREELGPVNDPGVHGVRRIEGVGADPGAVDVELHRSDRAGALEDGGERIDADPGA